MHSHAGRLTFSPSDLTGYLACRHLTQLERRVALGLLAKPAAENPEAELVKRKGEEHERAYLDRLRAAGRTVKEISLEPDLDWERAARETEEAIQAQTDVVYQGVFVDPDGWRGIADFLERQTDGTYEAVDTKLARHAKPAHVLQLCFYSEHVGRIQGSAPKLMHVELGSGEREKLRPEDFGAYYRRLRRRFLAFASEDRPSEPYPVSFCERCDFVTLCQKDWEDADHLSQVAWLRRTQFEKLRAAGISTLAQLAALPQADGAMARLREQAALQLHARETGEQVYRLLEPAPETGLALLPEPSPGDLFFDMEGNPFWDPQGGLEYLFGVLDTEGRFTAFWAHDREGERRAFERFVDFVHERLAADPRLHVYHYAQYEVTALKRLMGQYGTREREVDDLLRRDVFVDLFAVVRNGVRVSQPKYSIKNLEVFLPIERRAEIKEGGTSILRFEEWMRTGDGAILEAIAAYNEEDCRATHLLRDWLLERKAEAIAEFGPIPTPPPKDPKEEKPEKVARAELRVSLLGTSDPAAGLAGELLDYHDRERKPVWWALFERMEASPEELTEDAESIGLLELVSGPEPVARSQAWTFTYPAQEHKIGLGQDVIDPATGFYAGDVTELDREERRLVLKRGPKLEDVPLPKALAPGGPFFTKAQEDALMRFGRSLLAGDGRYPAVESVLRRTPHPGPIQTNDLDELEQFLLTLDGGHLFVQGPPGSGKTWAGGRLVARLLDRGKRVGVASTSHKAIHKLLDEVEAGADELGLDLRGCKKASSGNPESFYESERIENRTDVAECLDWPLAAGTAWLFADQRFDAQLDYLFVDEGGQVSLADALAMGTCARNLVLLGDPLQLGQVLQGTHPEGAGVSVLEHLLGEAQTIAEDRGIFLERTFRLHPDVCRYISEAFYEGRLEPDPCTAERTTPLGTGVRYLPVEHEGRRQDSPEEAARIRVEIERLLAAGMRPSDIKIVAPYNAQVNLLREFVPAEVPVGTVDKFQGQEAEVVLYSMASSSGEDIPRSLEFLFSRNRLNVAISRARCLAYLVCSPRLLEVDARTIEHMRLANALCRFVEIAEEQAAARV
ncbi:MAG TPA: TM0106 family RecB-like putative nuclease [Gaiellaceae bacterium]|nr:TM0106 family RecB-like putative nuclease [Gaiellaceae bacterium]